MRRLAVALALALLSAACSESPCEKLGERLCACTGLSSESCRTQVQNQLDSVHISDSACDAYLASCNAPAGATFCEWLLTDDGKRACGIAAPQQ